MKLTHLANHNIDIQQGQEPETPGSPNLVPIWVLVLVDKDSGDVIQVGFRAPVRDTLVQKLTGGIVIANGDLSKLTEGI